MSDRRLAGHLGRRLQDRLRQPQGAFPDDLGWRHDLPLVFSSPSSRLGDSGVLLTGEPHGGGDLLDERAFPRHRPQFRRMVNRRLLNYGDQSRANVGPVKGRAVPEESESLKSRLELLLRLLSPISDRPWAYTDLAAWLRQLGLPIDEQTPKKWPGRGIPEGWARRLAEHAPKQGVVGLTQQWLVEGIGPRPRKGVALPPTAPTAGRSAPEGTSVGPAPTQGGTADAPFSADSAAEGSMVGETLKLLRELAHHDDVKISNGGRTWLAAQLSQLAVTYGAAQQVEAARALLGLAEDVRKATGA